MLGAFRDFNQRLSAFNERVNVFNACVRKDRLPAYLMPGGNLLGKFQINQVMSYREIITKSLRERASIFDTASNLSVPTPGSSSASILNLDDFEESKKIYDPSALGQDYMTLFGTNYVYRLKTSSIFEEGKVYIFEVFIVHNDIKLEE